MEDFSAIAFECILQPSILDTKVFGKSTIDRKTAVGILQELLTQLSSVTKTQIAVNNEGQSQQPDIGSMKKKAYIQLMVVRIASYLNWDFLELNDSPALQLLLLETLIQVLDSKKSEETATEKSKIASKFAKVLYNRWVLRTAPLLNYPAPPGNKAQIFNSAQSNIYCIIDPPTATTINASSTDALKCLTEISENLEREAIEIVPSKDSFKIGRDVEKEFLPEMFEENWTKIEKGAWGAQILSDLIAYYLFIEDYENCRKCLEKLKNIDPKISQKVVSESTIEAYDIATRMEIPENDQEIPLYQRVNEELSVKYKGQQKAYESLLSKNIPSRLESNFPFPHSDEAWKKVDLDGYDVLIQYLNGSKKINYGKPPSFSEKFDKNKSKNRKSENVRKRDLLLTLMREKRPDKILELIQDLQRSKDEKMSVNVRRSVARWHLEDMTIVRAAGRTIESDYVFILLVKVQQLTQMKDFEESMALVTAVERLFNDKPYGPEKAKAMYYLNILKVNLKMTEYNESKGLNMEEEDMESFVKDVRDSFDKMTSMSNANEAHSQVFEMLVATLLNLEQFDFILSRSDKCWNMVRLACLISSAVINFHRKHYNTGEFKERCRELADIILPVLQQSSKRSANRELQSRESQEKQWIKRLLKRIHSPQVLSLLCAFLVTYYNSIGEDASLEIQCELPMVPLTVNSSITVNEDNLLNFIQMLAGNSRNPSLSWSLRIQGEIHYAQGNYLAAMQNFITALIVSTQFFLKPWSNMQALTDATWDERIFVKMIKCTSELGHHAESMILCQFQSEVDYVTAFKALEERNAFDGMDALYQYLWDVTILEYAVSMHNKKGEFSRKKKALETISQLEINTNNNEEILREAQAARRSSFLRYMASNYIQ